jgi:exosortase
VNNPQTSESWDFVKWCRGNPVAVALVVTIACTFGFFFGALHLFVNGSETAARWAWLAWNPEQDQEHSVIVPFVFAWLIWHHWPELLKAPKGSSRMGLVFAGIGVLFFLMSTRCLEPRMALVAIPFLFYGSILFIWGKAVARILMFPCAFLVFLIPFGAIQQATFSLQHIITGIVSVLANMVGIANHASGTTLSGQNGTFKFEVADGCSGIHSIIAIIMLTTIYMHLMESQLWKKVVIVISSVGFAIIGNIGRIFTILLVAKLFNADIAGGKYHTISGYIIYPFAIMAMIGLSSLLNIDGSRDRNDSPKADSHRPKPRPRGPTYDYDY